MGRCHRSARQAVGRRVTGMPCREDVVPWGKDVQAASVVGEPGASVAAVGCTDGDGLRLTRR